MKSYQLKNGIRSFFAWRSAQMVWRENKPASLLVVFLGKALNRTLSSLCGRQVAPQIGSARIVVWRLVKIDPKSAKMPWDTTTNGSTPPDPSFFVKILFFY